jgi:hypothetical protein
VIYETYWHVQLIASEKEIVSFNFLKKFGEHKIKEVIYNLGKNMIYLITDKDKEQKKKVVVVHFDPETENFMVDIGLDGHHFQIDYNDEFKIYYLFENVVYTHTLEKKKEGFSNFISKGFGIMGGEKEEEGVNLFGSEEFFRAKEELTILRFEKDMEFFYLDDQQVIKKYKYDNKEVVVVYDDVQAKTSQIILHDKKQLMFRYAYYYKFSSLTLKVQITMAKSKYGTEKQEH